MSELKWNLIDGLPGFVVSGNKFGS